MIRRCNPRTSLAGAVAALVLSGAAATSVAEEGKLYGQPLGGEDTVPIGTLLAEPDRYLGQVVRVEGLVTGVCEKRGCWITLGSDDEEFREVRIKVDDGVIVFPMEARGRRAVAEGRFVRIELTMEQTLEYRAHHAREHGEEFDPASVTEPLVHYRIEGTGAVIRGR